jgi:hypothetical protein
LDRRLTAPEQPSFTSSFPACRSRWGSDLRYEQPGSDELVVIVPMLVDGLTVTLPQAKSRCQTPLLFW